MQFTEAIPITERKLKSFIFNRACIDIRWCKGCLLYTSDAADERSSVDLGGRRIIKKKKNMSVG